MWSFYISAIVNVCVFVPVCHSIHYADTLYHVSRVSDSCIFIRSISAYCRVATFLTVKKKKKLQCNSLRVTCVHDGKRQEKCLGRDFWHLWHVTLSATELWNKLFAFASVCTLTVLLVRLLLCQFLLRCDFQHCQAPAGFQLLWFVADDGTILTQRFAASNHSNRKGGELSGSWAHSQVMSSHSL